ncbi:MAG: ferritin [Clostridia bacterium]
MISAKLNQAINEQITFEFYSAHIYLSMAAYCVAMDLPGFSHFLRVQYREEVDHAMKFFNFVAEMEGNVKITGFQDPEADFASVLSAFEIALAHEKIVTGRIYDLKSIAVEEKNYAASGFLDWYVTEQIEEESNFTAIVRRLKMVAHDPAALYMLDNELATRIYTPLLEANI